MTSLLDGSSRDWDDAFMFDEDEEEDTVLPNVSTYFEKMRALEGGE
jgi:hypothetical protein